MKKIFTIAVLLLAFGMNAQEQPSLISVKGEGTVKVVPDQVVLNTRIEHEGKSASEVKKKNDIVVDAVIKYLKSVGVEPKDINTTYLNLNKTLNYQTNIVSYSANQSIAIKIRDLEKYETIVSGLLENGLNRIDGVQFQSSNIENLKEEARKKAINNAKEKAETYASALNQNIGAAFQVSEMDLNNFQPLARMEMMKASDMGEMETIAPGEMEISVNVNVSFYLFATME